MSKFEAPISRRPVLNQASKFRTHLMKLFDDANRNDLSPKRDNESIYGYLNNSGRPSVAGIRELVQAWFDRLPDNAKPQIMGRFCSPIDLHHRGAFFEIYLHELLCSMGFEIIVEPTMAEGTSTHPDFKVLLDSKPCFYLEATLASQSGADSAGDARISTFFDSIERTNSPNFMLAVRYSGTPKLTPPSRELRRDLEEWLARLDPEDIARINPETDFDKFPSLRWSHDDWNLEFTPVPKVPGARGKKGMPVVALIAPSGGAVVETHLAIKTAIRRKATKYGVLDLPYVIALNVIEPFAEERHVLNALLGSEHITVSLSNSGAWSQNSSRNPDGAWIGPSGPRNKRVSAVLAAIMLTPRLSHLRSPILIHNPWASQPLSPELWQLQQLVYNSGKNCFERVSGKDPADILTFPASWPLPDD